MKQVFETNPIRRILEEADQVVPIGDYTGVVIELFSDEFEGTIIYVPGIHLQEVQCELNASLRAAS